MHLLTALLCALTASLVSATAPYPPPLSSSLVVGFINGQRIAVNNPTGGNIHEVGWSMELAELAQEHADGCSLTKKKDLWTPNCKNVGQLYHSTPASDVPVKDDYVPSVLAGWASRGTYYNYEENVCTNFVDCRPYTQLVWADTVDVGCGISACNETETYFLVCFFSPGGNIFGLRPYIAGNPCANCETFEKCGDYTQNLCRCQNRTICGCPDPFRNTTSNMGGDPHFTVRLSSGHLLCYSVQGEPGSIFNLISSKDLEINALFIPQKKQTKTWLGVIGVVVNGRKLVFNVTSGTIQMDDSMKMEANLVEKIKLTSGKFYLTMMTGRARARHVEVDLAEFDVRFLIVFVGRQHLDLVWFSGGIEDKGSFHGLIGQFLRSGVRMEGSGLHLPQNKHPLGMHQRNQFGFLRRDIPDLYDGSEKCWTMRGMRDQGEGLIEGSYRDYLVNDVTFNGFKFKGQ